MLGSRRSRIRAEMNDSERRKNDEALTLMFLIVEDTFFGDIAVTVRTRDEWKALKEMHANFRVLRILRLRKDFFNVIMKPNETLKSYLGRLIDINRKNYVAVAVPSQTEKLHLLC
ncbi:hypothetical protein AVEN_107997-1 [Araneus ventricosus]|uniref:Uncharacterized protein n=1 Tax=Araneus ventricosus TaxID=182803 RepID=A0A4Y2DTC0_ARAVE|nr:hypothetical protein AVEN_107997-1 [Araneus ventricosus]